MNTLVTVVVVDDHPFFRDGVSRGLAASGRVRVVGEAADGLAGLELIRREKPDVAVVDHQMPHMTGVEVAHAVSRDGLPTRVLLLSAVTDGPIVFRALQEGAAGYLSKDADRDDMARRSAPTRSRAPARPGPGPMGGSRSPTTSSAR